MHANECHRITEGLDDDGWCNVLNLVRQKVLGKWKAGCGVVGLKRMT